MPQIVDVFYERKAGADGKTLHRGIDKKSDPVTPQQKDDEGRLAKLLGKGRNVPGESGRFDVDAREDRLVERQADNRGSAASRNRDENGSKANQFEAVHQLQQ